MNFSEQINEWVKQLDRLCVESVEIPVVVDKGDIKESGDFEFAKKLGYMGDERNVAEWLKGDYAKWKVHCMDIFKKISEGDEEKAQKLFDTYDFISKVSVVSAFEYKGKLMSGYEMLEDFKKNEIGDSEEFKELEDKLLKKWNDESKSVEEFYSTSSSRGGWTGD